MIITVIRASVAAVLALSQGGYSEALHGRATSWNGCVL
jgi:hypothetical protein